MTESLGRSWASKPKAGKRREEAGEEQIPDQYLYANDAAKGGSAELSCYLIISWAQDSNMYSLVFRFHCTSRFSLVLVQSVLELSL